ncbi:amino acid ABC transporter substrate-binding protein, PAAT family [Mariprofundus ferrinatatus]|uniref:Amino acid ABC transporter substrate-binding protein, PAAT family n=1 Tax=Mariprofundus ferrinatatus TaxID=1921087 RepID=A0A2K8L4S5_9PROT|nr:transporter substrate-binding domain-containing protein [Mariprofundus ferrinatatus]ATX82112.1 amino acid ABC transporter substrate-binding protein, PAAT family [Mariprofundus ferrinatatus]
MKLQPLFGRLICGLAMLLALGAGNGLAGDRGSSISLDANESPPFWSESMPNDGLCGEIVHAASEAVGLVSQINYKPLKRMIEDDSNNDLGNPEFYMGNQDFAAVVPVCIYHVGLFYYAPNHAEKVEVSRIEDLKGYKVGILKGTMVDDSLFTTAGVTFEESYSQESLFKKLIRGRVDLVIEIDLVGKKIIDRLFPAEHDNFVATTIPGSAMPIAVLISADYPDAERVGALYRLGMARIKQSGRYREILETYYGKGKVPDQMDEEMKRFEYIYSLVEDQE